MKDDIEVSGRAYKVLKSGRSFHGGELEWSLPAQREGVWTPGEWHSVEVELQEYTHGLHVTDDPAVWWSTDAGLQCFEVEYEEGVRVGTSDKICCRRVRLMRPVEDLTALRIANEGEYNWEINRNSHVFIYGSAKATVTTYGRSQATVKTLGSSQATVKMWNISQATVKTYESGQATVETHGSSQATVKTYGSSRATVKTHDHSVVIDRSTVPPTIHTGWVRE